MSSNAERQRREALNQAVFRDVNEEIRGAYEAHEAEDDGADGMPTFVCECGEGTCLAMIPLPLEKYRQIRVDPRRFLVASGHEAPDAERVVERHDRWSVVETFAEAATVARAEANERRGERAGSG